LSKNKTIMISTHILQEAEAVANRILLVHEGRLVFDGLPDELRRHGSMEEKFYDLTNYGRAAAEEGGQA
jgi:ABC-2 type transport system ATP-binding protein